MSVWVG